MSDELDRRKLRALPIIVADVSSATDAGPRIEIHRLLACQPSGLGIAACGVEQVARGHGWFYLENLYQFSRVADGSWPICGLCLPGEVQPSATP